jgi:hypothetical protein
MELEQQHLPDPDPDVQEGHFLPHIFAEVLQQQQQPEGHAKGLEHMLQAQNSSGLAHACVILSTTVEEKQHPASAYFSITAASLPQPLYIISDQLSVLTAATPLHHNDHHHRSGLSEPLAYCAALVMTDDSGALKPQKESDPCSTQTFFTSPLKAAVSPFSESDLPLMDLHSQEGWCVRPPAVQMHGKVFNTGAEETACVVEQVLISPTQLTHDSSAYYLHRMERQRPVPLICENAMLTREEADEPSSHRGILQDMCFWLNPLSATCDRATSLAAANSAVMEPAPCWLQENKPAPAAPATAASPQTSDEICFWLNPVAASKMGEEIYEIGNAMCDTMSDAGTEHACDKVGLVDSSFQQVADPVITPRYTREGAAVTVEE